MDGEGLIVDAIPDAGLHQFIGTAEVGFVAQAW